MTVIGLDPGVNGGIAWIANGKACVEKMPDTLQDLWELIDNIRLASQIEVGRYYDNTHIRAYLEQVSSSPQMGVKSSFTFGNGFGHLEMALTAAGIPFERVRPQVWQKAMGCMTGGDKNVSKRKAQELFPQIKCTHATSDALLIAEFGRRKNN